MKSATFLFLILGLVGSAHAMQDRFGSMREDVARSSVLASADSGVTAYISSPVIYYGVEVSSPSPNSWITILSTGTPVPSSSTEAWVNTSVSAPNYVKPVRLPNGLSYNKSGGSAVRILWDFLTNR